MTTLEDWEHDDGSVLEHRIYKKTGATKIVQWFSTKRAKMSPMGDGSILIKNSIDGNRRT